MLLLLLQAIHGHNLLRGYDLNVSFLSSLVESVKIFQNLLLLQVPPLCVDLFTMSALHFNGQNGIKVNPSFYKSQFRGM